MTKRIYKFFCSGLLLIIAASSFSYYGPPLEQNPVESRLDAAAGSLQTDVAAWEAILIKARESLGWENSGFTTGGGGNIYITHSAVFGGQCSADPFIDENGEYAFLDIGGSWPTPGGDDTSEDFTFHNLPAVRINRVNARGNLTQQTIAWKMGDTVFKAYMKISCPEDGGRVDALPYAEALYAAASAGDDPCANVECSPNYCSDDGSTRYYDCACDPADGQCYCYTESCPAGCDAAQGACFPYEEPTVEASPTPLASDLVIEDLVLLQAIQGGKLVARKPTALRVFLNGGFTDQQQQAVVTLHIDGIPFGEQIYLVKPRKYIQDMSDKEILDMVYVTNSANFHIPATLLTGTVPHSFSISAHWVDESLVDPDLSNNTFLLKDVNFTDTRSLNILFEPWASDITMQNLAAFTSQARIDILNMMPVQDIPYVVMLAFDYEYIDEIGLGLPVINPYFQLLKLNDITWKRRLFNARAAAGLESGRQVDMAVGVFHEYEQGGGTIRGNSWVATVLFPLIHQASWVAIERPSVIVHEIGHQLFGDEYTPKTKGIPLPVDSVIYFGQQKKLTGLWLNQQTTGRYVNIMGDDHFWPNIQTWDAFVDFYTLKGSATGRVTAGPALASPRMQAGTPIEGYLLSGSISPSGTVENTHSMWLQNQDADPNQEGDSLYWLEALRPDGSQLGVVPVYPDSISEEGAPFLAFLPARQAETAEVRLVQEGQVIWSISPSPSMPAISVNAVGAPGAMLEEVQPVSWLASDADGEALQYHVLFSHDSGETWLPLIVNRDNPAYDLDPDALPGCTDCLLKVIASDGWHSAEADAPGTFTIADKAPYVSIISPEDMSELEEDEAALLSASAYDMEDGLLADDRITWESDMDGPLGSGAYLTLDALSAGTHTITLSAADRQGQQGQASIQVIVGRGTGGEDGGMGGFYAVLAVIALLLIAGAAALLVIMKRKGNKTVVIISGVLLGVSVLCLLASIVLMFAGSPATDGDGGGGMEDTPDGEDFSHEPSAWPTAIVLPTNTAPAGPPPAATPEAGPIIVRDDFTSPRGWPDISEARADAGLSEGGIYTVSFWTAGDSEPLILEQPEPLPYPPEDMTVRVNASGMNEAGAGAYGLVCRVAGSDLYGFHVANDGRYWVYKSVESQVTTLDSGRNAAITDGTNALEMRCVGDQIISSANGVQVSQVSDSDLAAGNAGLFAQPLGGELVGPWSFYAQFDDFAAEFTYKEGAG